MLRRESRTQTIRKKLRYSFKSLKGYKYVNDYNNTSLKECQRYDDENQYLYEKNVALYNRTSKMLEKRNAIFGMPEPPRRPRSPSNVELFVIFKRRKEKTDNKLQTLAVIYLLQKDYNLIVDPDVSLINNMKKTFEPYQAIELAEKVARENNENYIKNMLEYVNENKIFLKDEPQDKTVSQKIKFYNNQNVILRKKSNSSIGSRERSNSDTFVIEQQVNETRAKTQAMVQESNQIQNRNQTQTRNTSQRNYSFNSGLRNESNPFSEQSMRQNMPYSSSNQIGLQTDVVQNQVILPLPSAPPNNILINDSSMTTKPPAYC